MKKEILTLLTALFVLTGCSGKNEISQMLQPDVIYEKALVHTREAQIIRSFETKASISATLLNEVFPQRYSYEKGVFFFVGVITDMKAEEFKKRYHITLNGDEPVNIEPVTRNDDLYILMPSVTRWGKYWIVTFPPQKAKKFVIDFGIDPYGSVELAFQRPMPRR
ncbi:hypothetical protein [Hydrogenimonas cancrithermarum]|uniref:hypothetical protein n=1 Tax=Hydrogenimonas cancrithermarum TaxID=2993563 RepID=UPI00257468D6|nr:hypothetical protein [Hydrogenimonas cancrithermarum]